MKVTFLGTGTSHGVPMIGCDCPVCTSTNPHNNRTRCSVIVEVNGKYLLIDTPPELRIQAIRERIKTVDAILFTHQHADHIFGLDDVRRFNDFSGETMKCYGSGDTLKTLLQAFEYVFVPTQVGGGKPSLELIKVNAPFKAAGVDITPVPIFHGKLSIFGYRIGDFAYITDCSSIPHESMKLLANLKVLVLGALRPEPHETHFSISEALAVVQELNPEYAYFTHISHRLEHRKTNDSLPPNIQLAYDGLKIEI